MRKYRYTGPGPVDVPALGLVNIAPGTVVEVHDPDLADNLPGDLWAHIPNPRRSRAAKKAAAAREEESEPATDETPEG